jgi:hypothetical protein
MLRCCASLPGEFAVNPSSRIRALAEAEGFDIEPDSTVLRQKKGVANDQQTFVLDLRRAGKPCPGKQPSQSTDWCAISDYRCRLRPHRCDL